MATATTSGVRVSVESSYQAEFSAPENQHFMFAYRISIENGGDCAIQLISRHWDILDAAGTARLVEGEGVVGEQPILSPGEKYAYTSGCNLGTEMGSMRGYYVFQRGDDGQLFKVDIPAFTLIATYKLN